MLGLAALSGFAVAYAHAAQQAGWPTSLAIGWTVTAGIGPPWPPLARVLAVFTHRERGAAAVADLLRGMLHGMAGFPVFCALVGRAGVPAALLTSALAVIGVQALLQGMSRPAT